MMTKSLKAATGTTILKTLITTASMIMLIITRVLIKTEEGEMTETLVLVVVLISLMIALIIIVPTISAHIAKIRTAS